jgi:uncharacterized Zn-finger protein
VPNDPHAFDEDDEPRDEGRRRKFRELDCPECSAVTPLDDGFGDGDDVLCCYCGLEFRATVSDGGRLKLRET